MGLKLPDLRGLSLPRAKGPEVMALVGSVAAVVLAVAVNVEAARHYTRWDWTADRRYTLSEATRATLDELSSPVDVWVLVGANEPILVPIKQLLVAYEAASKRIVVHYVDPDKDVALLEDVRQKFHIETGRTSDGHVVTDAIVVVASEGRHWFLGPQDLVEVSDAEAKRVRPREEQAFTHAIRQVRGGEKAVVCVTVGHGEAALDDAGDRGLRPFRDVLEKDNYDVRPVDTTAPDAQEPFTGCSVVVVAGPRAPFSPAEAERLRTHLLNGGSLLAALGPIPGAGGAVVSPGLARALEPFGIALDDAVVLEGDRARSLPETRGAVLVPDVKEHAITAGLLPRGEGQPAPRVTLELPRPVRAVSTPSAAALPLLASSPESYAVAQVAAAALAPRGAGDTRGPFTLALASERPNATGGKTRGSRVVVVGASGLLDGRNFGEPLPFRGAALFAESALAWLAARPAILDIPARATVPAGLRISEAARDEVRTYVLVYMPLAMALLAIAVGLRRRSTEGKEPGKSNRKSNGESEGKRA